MNSSAEPPVAVLTGPTRGIGRWIALGLARAGYHLVLLARDPVRAETTRAWITALAPGAVTEPVIADLSLLREVKRAAREIAERHERLALLVNNAGLITRRRELTEEGRERILAVNHLAPFVLTGALAGLLGAGRPARIVNVGSAASERARLSLDDLEGARRWRAFPAYAQSKLALLMTGLEWAHALAPVGITVNTVHPGVVATDIAARGGLMGLAWRAAGLFALSPERGADAPLHVALAPELAGTTGAYFRREAQAAPNQLAHDPALRARLWEATERLAEA